MANEQAADKRTRAASQQRKHPAMPLEQALELVTAICAKNAGKPMELSLLAEAIGRSKGSSDFRFLLSSANQYGLTSGSANSASIALTELGLRICRPLSADDRRAAIAEAACNPQLIAKIYEHYRGSILPEEHFFRNALERQFGVDPRWSDELAKRVYDNGIYAGIIDSTRAVLSAPEAVATGSTSTPTEDPALEADQQVEAGDAALTCDEASEQPAQSQDRRDLLVLHGRDKDALNQLTSILNEFNIPYKIAEREANQGRPISQKIADIFRQCGAAILLFTPDETLYDKSGNEIWRPSENVVFELGAASFAYGSKIIVIKHETIKFASNYQDIGYISFGDDGLNSKALEVIRELIALKMLRLVPE